jgi:hypothetical protein
VEWIQIRKKTINSDTQKRKYEEVSSKEGIVDIPWRAGGYRL